MRDRYVIRGRYYVLWSGDTGFVLLGMVAGVLFIALIHLTSDEMPPGLAIPSALLWIFLMRVMGHAPYRDLGIVRSFVVFQIDEEGIYFGMDPAQHVPWSRITRIVLHHNGTGKGGTTQDVAVSMSGGSGSR